MARKILLAKDSRYTKTTLVQVRGQDKTLVNSYYWGVWTPTDIPISNNDIYYKVKESDIGRLDLLCFKIYGNSNFWWLIAYINDIADPMFDIAVGDTIRLPPLRNIQETLFGLAEPTSVNLSTTE